jgi:uncharacterized membrane protein
MIKHDGGGISLMRGAAAIVALIAWAGLLIQTAVTYSMTGSWWSTLAALLWYFTVLANLLVAIVFSGVALDVPKFRSASLMAGTTLAMMLVGVVYRLLLQNLFELTPWGKVADTLQHAVTPVLTVAYWFVIAKKGRLRWRDPLLWAVFPLAYLVYALLRGAVTHRYPYPFINCNVLTAGQVVTNVIAISACFLVCGYLFVWLDRMAGRNGAQH